jgi:hypothetical protein
MLLEAVAALAGGYVVRMGIDADTHRVEQETARLEAELRKLRGEPDELYACPVFSSPTLFTAEEFGEVRRAVDTVLPLIERGAARARHNVRRE